ACSLPKDLTGPLFRQILRRIERLACIRHDRADAPQRIEPTRAGVSSRATLTSELVDGATLRVRHTTNMEADTGMTNDRGPCVGPAQKVQPKVDDTRSHAGVGWRRWLVLLGVLCVLG